ncbi:AMP-binding protein [Neobacillus niacini]|uniref:AMP-binding protein n=1 Tax=Neobacillus niacini TaxID=86668 RepID=UPI002FFEB84E
MVQEYKLNQKTIGNILQDKAKKNKTKIALKYYGESFSYQFMDEHTNRLANGLLKLGIKKGDHITVIISNRPEFLWTIFAIGKIGAVAVPINIFSKGELLYYFIDNSDSKWVVTDLEFSQKISSISKPLSKVEGLVYLSSETYSDSENLTLLNSMNKRLVDFSSLENESNLLPEFNIQPSDPYLIMYTSGTTGPSKGVVSPHSQGISVGCQVGKAYEYNESDTIYTCLPLFHGNALWYSAFPALLSDATLAISKRFSATNFWDEIQASEATQFNSLGAMTNIILKTSKDKPHQHNKVRQCMVVPSLGAEISEDFESRFDLKLTSLYAMTETFAVTIFGPNEPKSKVGSSGRPLKYVDVKIVDEENNFLPNGEVGEIVIRPNEPGIMMSGYYKMPEATLKSMSDLWFHTGDRGYLDSDGYLYFVDRKKDSIRRRGENISAYEIEMILSKHDSIYEVAAIPIPSELSEDEVMVYIVLQNGQELTYEDVIRYCNDNMSYFMVPKYVHFIDTLPKTPSEKIEKYKLVNWAKENLERIWDQTKSGIELNR